MSALFWNHPKQTDLALFAGGESGPLSRWRIERHIESCAECEAAVSDYFHLADELQPLADLPEVNWDAMALGIERRLASEASAEERRPLVPAMAWVGSLAAVAVISGIIVVRQQPTAAPNQQVALESSASTADLGQSVRVLEEEAVPLEAAPAAAPQALFAEQKAKKAKEAAAPAAEPEQFARLEKREAMEADRMDLALADEIAPAPPPPPAELASEPTAATRESFASPARRVAANAGAVLGEASAEGVIGLRGAPPAAASASPVDASALDIQPLFDRVSNVRVASNGRISVRAISAEGRVTITDVYTP